MHRSPQNPAGISKPKPKRVITEARKIQNREAQRAYRQRQKERLRAAKESQEHRSSPSAYHHLRPHPPLVERSPDVSSNPSLYSWNYPIQVYPGPGDGEIVHPHVHHPFHLSEPAARSDPLPSLHTTPPDSHGHSPAPSNPIGSFPDTHPQLHAYPPPPHGAAAAPAGMADLSAAQGVFHSLDFFQTSSSDADVDSYVSSLDEFLGPIDEHLLMSFQAQDPNNPPPPSASLPSQQHHHQQHPTPRPDHDYAHDQDTTPEHDPTPGAKKKDEIPNDTPSPEAESLPLHSPAIEPSDHTTTTTTTTTTTSTSQTQDSSPLADPYANRLDTLRSFFLAGTMQNAESLGMSIEQFFGLNCSSLGSPFYQDLGSAAGAASTDPKTLLAAVVAANPFVPTHLRPTLPQILIQHHPLFDLIPMAELRSRAIILGAAVPGLVDMGDLKMDIIDGGLVCKGGGSGSGQPWDLRSWQVAPWFSKKWRLLMDGEGGDLYG
ncbi:hypothetical protein BDW62DRAFT_205937 [Aspergillus aurantiobrunneus]